MSAKTIESSELVELLPTGLENANGAYQSKFQKSVFGTFSANGIVFPNIYAMDLSWDTNADLIVHEPEDFGATIDFSFMIQGGIASDFSGLRDELVVSKGQHNFKFSPGKNHRHKMHKAEPLNVVQISMDKDFFSSLIGVEDKWSESIIRKIEKREPFVGAQSSPSVTPVMSHLIGSLRSEEGQGGIANLRRQSIVLELLALQLEQFKLLDDNSTTIEFSLHDQEKLRALRSYLQQHFLEELSLTGLSRISTLNEFKLKKGFRSLFNTSVFGYVKQLRMDYAVRLIRDDKKTIDEVAALLGYEYSNHFSRAFKKHYGANPSSFY